MHVRSPAEYEDLRTKVYPTDTIAYVEAGAHPDVLGQARLWANSHFQQITFTDKFGNAIELHLKLKGVIGTFVEGADHFHQLPTNYPIYRVIVGDNAFATSDDFEAIAKWQGAKIIQIFDEGNFTFRFIRRVAAGLLSQHNELRQLELTVPRFFFEHIDLQPIFAKVEELKMLEVKFGNGLRKDDLAAFTERQTVPDGFVARVSDHAVVYQKQN